jgi:hypothetical protein
MQKVIILDKSDEMSHDDPLDPFFMIQNEKHPKLYYRNERARFWADNTFIGGVSATEFLAEESNRQGKNYLVIHPEEDILDIPFDYGGWIIQYDKSDPIFASNNYSKVN